MNIRQCSEWGVIVRDDKGSRLGSQRHFTSYDEAGEWAHRVSAHCAVEACQDGNTGGVGEIVVLGYARIGDAKPAVKEVQP